jgi:hypothetical protein
MPYLCRCSSGEVESLYWFFFEAIWWNLGRIQANLFRNNISVAAYRLGVNSGNHEWCPHLCTGTDRNCEYSWKLKGKQFVFINGMKFNCISNSQGITLFLSLPLFSLLCFVLPFSYIIYIPPFSHLPSISFICQSYCNFTLLSICSQLLICLGQ